MKKKFLVCIDSDGCAFDAMEIKHKECFCPAYINYFGLQAVSKYARETWEFANLYSCWRGVNRFLVLLKSLELLAERKDVQERNFATPELTELRKYVEEGRPLNAKGIETEPIRWDEYTQKRMTFFRDPDDLPLEIHE